MQLFKIAKKILSALMKEKSKLAIAQEASLALTEWSFSLFVEPSSRRHESARSS